MINRSLTNVRTELEFLKEEGVVTDALFAYLLELLPQKFVKGQPPADVKTPAALDAREQLSHQLESTRIDSGAQELQAAPAGARPPAPAPAQHEEVLGFYEAEYDYEPQQAEDVRLRAGDKVQVLAHLSDEWWRGRVSSSGQTGVFPASYVKQVGGNDGEHRGMFLSHESEKQQYYPPQQYSSPPPPQQYYPPPQQQQYYPPQQYSPAPPQQPVQQQPQQVVVEQPHEEHKHLGMVKKFGSKLGNAAIFGAGATIGSDIVNSIF